MLVPIETYSICDVSGRGWGSGPKLSPRLDQHKPELIGAGFVGV